ncbi:MAG: F0F1 ATP synthase subunit A [Actinobacteria bacterium]|nr:F0F1 ATP synthase subunit A [Actinomycetota bacterium]
MALSAAMAALLPMQGDTGGFQPPTVTESFFYDAVGNGSVIASWKVVGLLVIGTAAILVFFLATARRAAVVPSKVQFFAEGIYGFVRNGIAIEVMGRAGRGWAPFLSTMFVFILVMNIYEIIPVAAVPVTSHFVFPAALAAMVWVLYNFVGIKKHGLLGYLKATCVIPGIPLPMHILLIPMEFLSKILLQPFTLAVRLFANMFAGHMLVVVAGAGTIYLLESGGLNYAMAVLPALASVGLWFFELLICSLQAYVFVLLTAIYLEAAMADSH